MTTTTHNSVLAEAIFAADRAGDAGQTNHLGYCWHSRFGRGREDQNPNVPSSDDHGHLRRAEHRRSLWHAFGTG